MTPCPFLTCSPGLCQAPDVHYRTSVPAFGSLSWQSSCHGNQWFHIGQSTERLSNGQILANTLCSIRKESLKGYRCNKGFTATCLEGKKTLYKSPLEKGFIAIFMFFSFLLLLMAFFSWRQIPADHSAEVLLNTSSALQSCCPSLMSCRSSIFLFRVPETYWVPPIAPV